MKKLITITLAALLAAVSLWGCNTANNADNLSDTATPQPQIDMLENSIENNLSSSTDEKALILELEIQTSIAENTIERNLKSKSTEETSIFADFESYDSIITVYRKIVELCPKYEVVKDSDYFIFPNDNARDLYEKIFSSTLLLYPEHSSVVDKNCYNRFGYTVKDLNSDGIEELILRLDNHQVIAIFSMEGEKPILLGNFWNRRKCWIDPDGLLHISGSSGACNSISGIYEISQNAAELVLLCEGGTDGYDVENDTAIYYYSINGEKNYLSENDYDEWRQSLPYASFAVTEQISEYMKFVPLFDKNHPAPDPYIPYIKG